jgi:hypothetical protein
MVTSIYVRNSRYISAICRHVTYCTRILDDDVIILYKLYIFIYICILYK